MFNISGVELAVIAIAALLLLGPQRLPEVARGLGKFLREFRRQTDDVRTMVEREFYQMDQEIQKVVEPVTDSVHEAMADKPANAASTVSQAASTSSNRFNSKWISSKSRSHRAAVTGLPDCA